MNAPLLTTAPAPDKGVMVEALQALFRPDDVIELRALHTKGRKRTTAGCFDAEHWPQLVKHAESLNHQGAAVYVTLNPLNPQLLGRYHNRVQDFAEATAADHDVVARRWLLVDVDPQRPKGTSATDAQLAAAQATAHAISEHLEWAMSWPEPIIAESGNGLHLLYPLDLPNDPASRDLVKAALQGLARRFDTDDVKVDVSVSNAARITKLYGTVANKGDHTAATPWRLSRLVAVPQRGEPVSVEQLQEAAKLQAPGHEEEIADFSHINPEGTGAPFDLGGFMSKLGIAFDRDVHEGSERYKLHHCPFNPEHGRGEAAILRRPNGALAFKCFHNSCADHTWHTLRELVDGPRESRTRGQPEGSGHTGEWVDPLPIPDALLPVESFEYALLPKSIRPWVSDIAERMQCPPDFVAVGAMVALSSVIGRKACIAPKRHDDWRVIPNLWGVVVGRPGVMKSPALSEVMKPIGRLAATANERHAEAMRDYEVAAQLDELAVKDTKDRAQKLVKQSKYIEAKQLLTEGAAQTAPPPPPLRRYKVTDSTVESLGEILIENPWGVLCYRDELHGLLRSLDKEGQEGARAFYLQAYDGNQGYTFDRIMRGRNLHISAVCVSMLGGIQPGKLQAYIHDAVKGGAGDDGLLQRFGLLVWPDVEPEWRNVDRYPDTVSKNEAFEVFKRLDALPGGTDPETGETAPTEYRFAADAQDEFDSWRHDFETSLRAGTHHPAIESHLSKYRKLVPALALVCALADGGEYVSLDALLMALAWAEYLQSHAMRAYAAGTRIQMDGARALLGKIKAGKVRDGFTPRDVYNNGWALLTDRAEVRQATDALCDLGYLRMTQRAPGAEGGRPSFSFQIHPAIRTDGGEA